MYLAHDTKLDRDVAVALIKTEGLDSDGLSRVRREAQAMGRLGDHPHIVTVFDIGEDESTTDSRQAPQPYIVSQYMAGGDLASVLDKAEGRRLPLAEALRMADQVCQGLEHAHSHGIIHRDLKPGNIWLTEPSTPSAQADAKIGDFGLAVALDRSRLTVAGMMVGTASYMPPEQAVGGEASRLSDLYALGCVLYEMMTGRPPFVGDDTVAVISQHLNTAPVAPTWHNSECPAGVEALILRLLEKDPGQRPAGADEVRQALTTAARASTSAPEPAAAAPEAANPIYRRTFVGREQELKQLEQAFDAALSGHSRLLMVVGEPGIGKTTLTEQLATYSGMRGGQTLVGHCYEEGSLSLPYLPFVEAMRTYTTSHDPDALLKQLGSGAAELARIVSEIRDKIQVDLPAPGSPEEERFRLFQAVTTFLRNAANVQPLCIVLEDLHDADKGTLDMLVHLARNLGRARVLLVGTYRDVEVDRTHPLSPALAELRRLESFQRIPLRGLSPDEVQRMLSNIAGQEVPYVLAEAIYRQTEGNPLFIQELIRNAAEEGLIKREGGQWIVTVDSLLNYIPEGLRDVIGRRLSRLSDSCNRILSVAAVIGRDFAVPVLQQVAGVSEEDMLLALEEATRVSLIEEMRGGREIRYRFTHAFFRQTLYEEMIAPRRLRMHNEVAKSLEAHYQGHLQEHAAELAEHFSHSSTEEDLQKAVEYGELAAERATSVYAFGEAARLLEQALEVQDVLGSRDDAKRYDLLMELAACLLSGGEPKRLFESVAPEAFAIAERLGGGVRAARAAEQAVWAALYHWGSVSFVMPEYRAWCERVDKHAPPESRERVMADCFISWTHWTLKDQETCWQLRRHALELARRIGDPDALSYAMFSFIVVGGPIDWEEERFQVAQELRDVPRSGLAPVLLSQMLYSLAEIFVNHGDRATADRYWSELDEYVKRVPDPYAHSWQVLCESYRLLMRGEHEKVVEVSQELAANATALGIELWGQLMGAWSASGALTDLGRYEELLASQWTWGSLPHGDAVIAFQLALMGRTDEAREKVRKVTTERGIGKPDDLIEGATLVVLLQAAVLAADVESTSLLYERLKGMDDWYAVKIMTSGRALGTAAALLGDPEAARRHLLAGLELAKQIEDRPETAWVRLALAGLLFEHFPDERAEAAEHLNLAVREFRDMKMQPALEDAMRLKLKFQGITSSDVYTSLDTVARVVQEEKPDLRPHAAPDGTVTILFSDIEGSTQMADRLGDKQFMEVLREHNAIVRSKVQKYEGFEVKSEGDGFMVAFQSARRAVDCAMGVQIALAERNEDAAQAVNVRMGLHAGETIREGEDFFGKNVILAARIASQARGGQILVSSLLKALVDSAGDLAFDEGREIELKGLSGTHRMHEVLWSRDGERPAEAALEPAPSVSAAIDQAEVRYCTTEDGVRVAYTMYGEGPAIVFAPYFTESFSMQNEIPEERDFYAQLGKGRTVVRYDGRGTGLSERDVGDCSHESMVRDLESVVKATGLRDFALWGQVLAGPRAIEFATRHPELRLRLILVSTFAKAIEVMPRAQIEALVTLSRTNWDLAAQLFADVVGREQSDANVRRGTLFRESASGEVAAMMLEGIYEADVTDLLPLVKAPTLILQRANDNLFRMDFGKTMAAAIPNARLVPLEGETVMYDPRDVAAIVQAVDNFLSEG